MNHIHGATEREAVRQRILFIRLGGLGDIVFTLPAVQVVRRAFPNAQLTFLVYREFASLLSGFPGVEQVLTLNRARFRNPLFAPGEAIHLVGELVRSRFDLVIDFQGFGETGLLAFLTGARVRWGAVYRSTRRWAYTRPVLRDARLHPVDYHLQLLREAGGLSISEVRNEFDPPESAKLEARKLLIAEKTNPDLPILFIQPFTSVPHKNWSLDLYLGIARYWSEKGVQVIFGGGPGDRIALEPARNAGFLVTAGVSALMSASLLRLSSVALGGDTGLLHLGVAMGKRVIMLMASTEPGTCYPYGHKGWAVVPAAGAHVSLITPEAVNSACAQAFANVQSTVV